MTANESSAAFLAVTSCGATLEAWPIEVAWCFGAGEVRSMLIKPDGAWQLDSWDKSSESDHRIGLELLLREGKAALDACLVLNAALGQTAVVSAAPENDSLWLYKLYRAADVEPNFRLVPAEHMPSDDSLRATTRIEGLREAAGYAQTG
ncbi:MAG: hypothetical protein HRU11_11745 [Parvularculaceae bacterium]|nr:hypothetical protein [Parvularculaceae bacterium]